MHRKRQGGLGGNSEFILGDQKLKGLRLFLFPHLKFKAYILYFRSVSSPAPPSTTSHLGATTV